MKKLLTIITSICLWQISFSQTVSLDSVQFYEGKTITVCSKVIDTYVSKTNEGTTFINFGKPYPKSYFYYLNIYTTKTAKTETQKPIINQ
jgi:hypothetical protein